MSKPFSSAGSIFVINSFCQDGGAEFVFATDSQKKRGWGERMFSSIGTSYMTGMYLLFNLKNV